MRDTQDSAEILNGKYRLDKQIGEGGFGEVHIATDLSLERQVAVKLLKREISESNEAADRFLNEARLTSRLTHPNTLTIYDFGKADGRLFLVSELLQGEPLSDRINRVGAIQPKDFIPMFIPVCYALAEAHQNGVIHRDLKPENLFVHKAIDGEKLVLLDFGIAKSMGDLHLTQTGQIFGTPYYMSPEQIRDAKNVDLRTDIYSLGIILYEVLSGEQPFGGNSLFDIFEKHIKAPVPLLSERISADLSVFDQLITKMMAKSINERPSSTLEVAEWLKQHAHIVVTPRVNAQVLFDQTLDFDSPQTSSLTSQNITPKTLVDQTLDSASLSHVSKQDIPQVLEPQPALGSSASPLNGQMTQSTWPSIEPESQEKSEKSNQSKFALLAIIALATTTGALSVALTMSSRSSVDGSAKVNQPPNQQVVLRLGQSTKEPSKKGEFDQGLKGSTQEAKLKDETGTLTRNLDSTSRSEHQSEGHLKIEAKPEGKPKPKPQLKRKRKPGHLKKQPMPKISGLKLGEFMPYYHPKKTASVKVKILGGEVASHLLSVTIKPKIGKFISSTSSKLGQSMSEMGTLKWTKEGKATVRVCYSQHCDQKTVMVKDLTKALDDL